MRGLLKRSGKRTVCGMVSSRNQKPPSWEKARVATALYHAEAFVCLLKSAPSRIMRVRPCGANHENGSWLSSVHLPRELLPLCSGTLPLSTSVQQGSGALGWVGGGRAEQ